MFKGIIFCLVATFLTASTFAGGSVQIEDWSILDPKIEKTIIHHVHPDFQKAARNLVLNPRTYRVSAENGFVVELLTGDLALEVEVKSPGIQFTQTQALPHLTQILFPRKEGDLTQCFGSFFCPTKEFQSRLKQSHLAVDDQETLSGKNYQLDFITFKKASALQGGIKVFTRAIFKENQNSFDEIESIGFGSNTCDESVCVGSVYTKVRLIEK